MNCIEHLFDSQVEHVFGAAIQTVTALRVTERGWTNRVGAAGSTESAPSDPTEGPHNEEKARTDENRHVPR